MSNLKDLYGQSGDKSQTSNFGVDFVIHYKVPSSERAEAEAGFVQLIQALTTVGLATEVRHGESESLLVFVKVASPDLFAKQVYRARLGDWLHGVRVSAPHSDVNQALQDEPVVESERLRLIYLMITKPRDEGGAGITTSNSNWKYVDSVFPLHSHNFNKKWIKKWSSKSTLEQADIDEIRDKFGESVAFYFAFLRSYFRWLVFPAGFGFVAWLLLGQFSFIYALLCGLWSVVFFEYWKKKEIDLAVQWGVRGVSSIQQARPEYQWDHEAEDPVTGEVVKVYEPMKRIKTQLLQIPFALACVIALGTLIVTCNSLEVFINEVYNGPGKQYLAFLPTVFLVLGTPTISGVLMKAAEKLNSMENYATVDTHDAALIQKQFVLNFMTSYMALFFTAFVYIPFGHVLVPFLEFWRKTAQVVTFSDKPLPTRDFQINPARISNQMFYFTVTAQVVNFVTEVVVPYVKREAFEKAKALKSKPKVQDDHDEEAEFLERVRKECTLEVYDVSGDYREMVMQFGYVAMFSVAWPLAAFCYLVNNWVELRSDALKIAISSRRPIPWRTDSIGPWLTALSFLSWLGSITSAAIVYLCSGARGHGSRGTPSPLKAWGLLLSILLAEHFYLIVQLAVRYVLSKVDSPGVQKERKERFMMKRKLLEENIGQGASEKASVPGIDHSEKITRAALEEEARQTSIRGHGTPEEIFWQRQRGMNETIDVGRRMIEQQKLAAQKNGQSKSPVPSMKAS